MLTGPELQFLLKNVLPPFACFAVVAYWIVTRRRRDGDERGAAGAWLAGIAFVGFTGLAVWLLYGLTSSDGWGGNLRLIAGFAAGGFAFHALVAWIETLIRGGSRGSESDRVSEARARAERRRRDHDR